MQGYIEMQEIQPQNEAEQLASSDEITGSIGAGTGLSTDENWINSIIDLQDGKTIFARFASSMVYPFFHQSLNNNHAMLGTQTDTERDEYHSTRRIVLGLGRANNGRFREWRFSRTESP